MKLNVPVLLMSVFLAQSVAWAEVPKQYPLPDSIRVDGNYNLPSAEITELKFKDFFKMPVGPKGLEPTQKLLELNGKRVRIVGYMARSDIETPGLLILTPMPVELGDADESLSDDLPPNALFVHTDASGLSDHKLVVPYIHGLVKLVGTLRVGGFEEVDGHVSQVRLELDPSIVKDLAQTITTISASK